MKDLVEIPKFGRQSIKKFLGKGKGKLKLQIELKPEVNIYRNERKIEVHDGVAKMRVSS